MCGRYFFGAETERDVEKELGLEEGLFAMTAGDITPAMSPKVITLPKERSPIKSYSKENFQKESSPKASFQEYSSPKDCLQKESPTNNLLVSDMFWGLTGKDKKLIINARAESVISRPMFSASIMLRRCVVPAAGFYEWDKNKNKVTFFRKDKSPIYLAGFYQLSENRDCFVILTTAANESMIKVHDRMPLMIERNDVRSWLGDNDAAKEMLSKQMPLLESNREYEQLSLF